MSKSLFAALIIISVQVANVANAEPLTKASVLKWSSIDKAPKGLLAAVDGSPKARFSELSVGQKMPLFLVDLSPQECGANACTVQAYVPNKKGTSYSKVLDVISDGMPEADNFVTPVNLGNQSCLDLRTGSKRVKAARWCFKGNSYSFEKGVAHDKEIGM